MGRGVRPELPYCRQPTANGERRTANREPRTVNGEPRTANGEPLGRMKAAVDGEGEAVQHAGRVAKQKTHDTGDVFALGKPTYWDSG